MKFLELILGKYKVIGFLALAGIIIHIISGKSRWQYYPMYLLGIIYFILILLDQFKVLDLSRALSKWVLGIGIFLFVISIDHSYGSQGVKFNDGTTIDIKKDAIKNSNLLVKTYGEDVISVLDDLEQLNENDEMFKGKMDLDSIGVLGHSTGGGGLVYSSVKDSRIKALLGLDAWLEPIQNEISKESLNIPALFLRSEQWSKGPNNKPLIDLVSNSKNAALIQMDKTNHVDFSMAYMYSPLTKYIGFTGKLGGIVSSEIQREFILDFFEYNLKNYEKKNQDYLKQIVEEYEVVKIIDIN